MIDTFTFIRELKEVGASLGFASKYLATFIKEEIVKEETKIAYLRSLLKISIIN